MQKAKPNTKAIATNDMKPASPSINFVFNSLWKLSSSTGATVSSVASIASTAAVSTAAESTAALSTIVAAESDSAAAASSVCAIMA